MTIYIDNHNFHYEMENLTRVFLQNEVIRIEKESFDTLEKPYIYTYMNNVDENNVEIKVSLVTENYNDTKSAIVLKNNDYELSMAILLYNILQKYTNYTPLWGVLTGVRPIKLMRRLILSMGEDRAYDYFKNNLLVSDKKIKLSIITAEKERHLISLSSKMSCSVYVSIPFCPTRCSYCSFVSQSVERATKLVEPYIELLCKEIEQTANIIKNLGLKLETIYIGGGTPTTLTAKQLEFLLKKINTVFDGISNCSEFTVEAGRPDTITEDKLKIILENGVTRISINPQTLNDEVLNAIGRKHSAKETIEAFELARKIGFNNINMDLIAGLPLDTLGSFKATIDKICDISPESVTIHTLAMKRSSQLTAERSKIERENIASDMLDYSQNILFANDYKPYYLYRQSKMADNLENVGWAKEGFESLYNVYTMDETHTILACGAGAVSKLRDWNSEYIERIFNFKYPYEYINRFNEMLERKEKVGVFYDKYFK